MSREQIILTIICVLGFLGIYQLPRVVVENDPLVEVQSAHDFSITSNDQTLLLNLNAKVGTEITQNTIIFADSLARIYLKYQMTDSATAVADRILHLDSEDALLKAGLIYYQAFQSSSAKGAIDKSARRAGEIFERLLQRREDLSIKSKLAMTKVVSSNPMDGVLMLREVLQADSTFREAWLNLGLLAIQSGQFERAIDRFQYLINQDESDSEAYFYYGVALAESDNIEKAKEVFEKLVKMEGVDVALKATATNYLKNL